MYQQLSAPTADPTCADIEPLYDSTPQYRHGRGTKNCMIAVVLALLCFAVVVTIIVLAVKFGGSKPPSKTNGNHTRPNATVSCGVVLGTLHDNVYVFRGIPYAVPPVGNLRWKPPEALDTSGKCWGDTYEATQYGKICLQYNEKTSAYEGCTDCLYLNIWTPRLEEAAKLPVMVYIHDGGLMVGSGNQPGFSPNSEITKKANVVFVSFNYRLNVFGFLALEALASRTANQTSANFGLLDQVLALKWVRRNIRAFGGDPDKVTVFGQGSGGTSIYALLSTTAAKGLFHRAWLMSPSPKVETSLQDAYKANAEFVNKTGCSSRTTEDTYQCLMNLDVKHVMKALPWQQWRNKQFRGLPTKDEHSASLLVIDGVLIKDDPIQTWLKGFVNQVPLLVGNVAQEVDDAPIPSDVHLWSWHSFDEYIKDGLGHFQTSDNFTQNALSLYDHVISPEYQLTSMVSDMRAICPLHEALRVLANKSTSMVYRYVITYSPSAPPVSADVGHVFAYHGLDAYTFFGGMSQLKEPAKHEDCHFASILHQMVLEFVQSGKLENRKSFPSMTQIIHNKVTSVTSYKADQCNFWRFNVLFPRYAWMN